MHGCRRSSPTRASAVRSSSGEPGRSSTRTASARPTASAACRSRPRPPATAGRSPRPLRLRRSTCWWPRAGSASMIRWRVTSRSFRTARPACAICSCTASGCPTTTSSTPTFRPAHGATQRRCCACWRTAEAPRRSCREAGSSTPASATTSRPWSSSASPGSAYTRFVQERLLAPLGLRDSFPGPAFFVDWPRPAHARLPRPRPAAGSASTSSTGRTSTAARTGTSRPST